MMKKAFTIVELMVVIAIIAVLVTIVFSAVKGSLAASRERRTEALCQTVQSGLAAYRAQYDRWPDPLGASVESGTFGGSNREGVDGRNNSDMYVLQPDEVRTLVKALVEEARKGNPLMDISGLFVSRSDGEPGCKGYGLDFMSAVHGSKLSPKKMRFSEMYFGYPDKNSGRFRRFKMVYAIPTDNLKVEVQEAQ